MSRFSNLEFGDHREDEPPFVSVVKDEAYYEQEAQQAFEAGDFEHALRSYAKVLEHNPNNTSAWTGQVRMLIELGEFREAKLWADKALENFPRDPDLLAAKAVALARSGDVNNALAFSDAAIEERGDTAYVWLARGDVLLAMKGRQAAFCIEQALARAHSWFFHWLASRVYAYYKKFSLAFKVAQEGMALDPTHCMIWLQLGQCQLALGMVAQATNSFEQARQLNPQCREAMLALIELAQTGPVRRLGRMWRRIFR